MTESRRAIVDGLIQQLHDLQEQRIKLDLAIRQMNEEYEWDEDRFRELVNIKDGVGQQQLALRKFIINLEPSLNEGAEGIERLWFF